MEELLIKANLLYSKNKDQIDKADMVQTKRNELNNENDKCLYTMNVLYAEKDFDEMANLYNYMIDINILATSSPATIIFNE